MKPALNDIVHVPGRGSCEVVEIAEQDTIIRCRTENGTEFLTDRSLVYRLDTE